MEHLFPATLKMNCPCQMSHSVHVWCMEQVADVNHHTNKNSIEFLTHMNLGVSMGEGDCDLSKYGPSSISSFYFLLSATRNLINSWMHRGSPLFVPKSECELP